MILNTGLDAACTIRGTSQPQQQYPYFGQFVRYAAIGTGSTEPSPTDTTLAAQVGARTDNRGGFDNAETGGFDPSTNTVWAESTFTRVFNITSNVNATEWGLAPATTGNLAVRELFRADPTDNNSSPITLTLEDGDQLQLVVTLRVEAAWEYETKSFVITGTAGNDTNGTHEGNATVTAGANMASSSAINALANVWPGQGADASVRIHYLLTSQAGLQKDESIPGSPVTYGTSVAAPYVAGTYYRDWTVTFGTSEANGDHYAWIAGSSRNSGLRFILTDPPYLTKASSHRLTLTVRKSIARL